MPMLPGHVLSFASVEAKLDAFGGLQHDVAAEHRELILPALDAIVRLQNPHHRVRHLGQREVLPCRMTLEGVSLNFPSLQLAAI